MEQVVDTTLGGRPTCYSCFRPKSHCVCGTVSPIEAHCNLLILQHPNEWRKYSTAKLVTKTIVNARTLRGVRLPGIIEDAFSWAASLYFVPI